MFYHAYSHVTRRHTNRYPNEVLWHKELGNIGHTGQKGTMRCPSRGYIHRRCGSSPKYGRGYVGSLTYLSTGIRSDKKTKKRTLQNHIPTQHCGQHPKHRSDGRHAQDTRNIKLRDEDASAGTGETSIVAFGDVSSTVHPDPVEKSVDPVVPD